MKKLPFNNPIEEFLLPLTRAISLLSADGILVIIYFYQDNECSCCYGPDDKLKADAIIEGNTANNMSWYDKDIQSFRVHFERNINKVLPIYHTISKALRGSGWKVDWDKDLSKCMFIKRVKDKTR